METKLVREFQMWEEHKKAGLRTSRCTAFVKKGTAQHAKWQERVKMGIMNAVQVHSHPFIVPGTVMFYYDNPEV